MGQIQSWLADPGETNEDEDAAQSAWGLVLTVAPTLITAVVLLTGFMILKRTNRRWYAPRTYLGSLRDHERTPELQGGPIASFKAFLKMPDATALRHQSLDAFLFLRYLRVCCTIAAVGVVLTWPVLFPVNATGGGGQSQLELLSWSNIDTKRTSARYRLFAHAFIAWIFLGFVLYTILRECIYFINLRQAFLLTPQNARRISSRTVLFTCVPTPYLEQDRLRKIFGDSAKNIWIAHDTKTVDDYVKERDKITFKLEAAEVKWIRAVNKARLKAAKKDGTDASAEVAPPLDGETGDIAERWLPRSKRPTHRTGFLGLVGPKVDTLDWCREKLATIVPNAESAQHHYRAGGYAKVSAVFIEFHTQSDAQAAFQIITHHQALHMAPKYIGVKPEEVVWKSLKFGWMTKLLRKYLVVGFIAALIVFCRFKASTRQTSPHQPLTPCRGPPGRRRRRHQPDLDTRSHPVPYLAQQAAKGDSRPHWWPPPANLDQSALQPGAHHHAPLRPPVGRGLALQH
jgi:hypothetical protein